MTKALLCRQCLDIRALPPANHEPVYCRCGNMAMWWTDYHRGTAQVSARVRHWAYFVGINNRFLVEALMDPGKTADQWQHLHGEAVKAPGYLFDASNRNCWALVVKVGHSNDVSFYEEPETTEATPGTRIAVPAPVLSRR